MTKPLLSFVTELVLESAWSFSHEERVTRVAKQLEQWHDRPLLLSDLTEDLLNRWLRDMEPGRSARTVISYRRHALLIWYAALKRGDKDHAPNTWRIRKPRAAPTMPVAWTIDEVRKLLDTAEKTTGKIGSIPASRFWPAIIRTDYDTGLRLGDVLSLNLDQISAQPTWVTQSKTGIPIAVAVHPSTLASVRETVPPRRSLAFPWPWQRKQFYFRFSKIVDAAGLVGTFRRLRRSSGSYVEREHPGCGGRHLGHKSPGVFSQHYEDPTISRSDVKLPPAID